MSGNRMQRIDLEVARIRTILQLCKLLGISGDHLARGRL